MNRLISIHHGVQSIVTVRQLELVLEIALHHACDGAEIAGSHPQILSPNKDTQ